MKVRYDEGTDALSIPAAGVIARRGEPVEVPDRIGESLLTQGFVKADAPKGKAADKKEKS